MDLRDSGVTLDAPARASDLGAAVSKFTGRSVGPAVIDCYLRLFEGRHRLAERGSHYLAHIA